MRQLNRHGPLAVAVLLLSTVAVGIGAAPAQAAPTSSVKTLTVRPEGPLPASTASTGQTAALQSRLLKMRSDIAAHQPAPPAGPRQARAANTRPTALSSAVRANSPLIRRNNANTVANSAGVPLAEPAATNDGNSVFYSGNGPCQSSSTDFGVTWTRATLPAGPADAPTAIGDSDAVRSHALDRTFGSMLYVNSALTNGIVRIFVRSQPESAPLCTYRIDPGGTADNLVPDYPHIGLSSNFLYLTTNNATSGKGWTGAQVTRLNASQMAMCASADTAVFTYTGTVGQRVLTPVEGAQNSTTMYFATLESASSLRIFSWPESAGAPTQIVRNINATAFGSPDCRGGTNNTNFVGSVDAIGFDRRGTVHGSRVTWFWNAAADASHTQAYVRAASFNISDLTLQAQPDIFNGGSCFAYPVVSGNGFGDVGISIANGGKAGGGGGAVQGAVGDDDTPSDGIFFSSLILTAAGTHNPSDGRFGDYFTIRTNARCTNTWVATNYALNGGTGTANVNARYVEFGSTLDSGCF